MTSATRTVAVPPAREGGPSPLRDRAFLALLAATFCAFCGYTLLLGVAPLWAMDGGAAQLGAGATTAVFMLTTVIAQLASPALLRRAAHGRVLAVGSAVLGLAAVMHLLSNDLTMVVATSAARGVGFGIVTVSGSALVAELLPVGHHGRGAGLYGIAVGIPNVCCLPGGVWVVGHGGFAPIFLMAGVLPLVGALFAATLRHRTSAASHRRQSVPRPRLAGQHVAGTAVMVTTSLATGAVVTFLPDALSLAVPALLIFSTATTVGRWGAGALNDRYGRPRVLGPAVVVAAVGMLCLAVAVGPARGYDVTTLAFGGALLLGAGFGAVQNDTLVAMFAAAPPGGYGAASTAWNVGFDAGTGIGAALVGVVAASHGYLPGFAVSAVIVLAGLPIAVRVARTARGGLPARS